MVIIGIMVMSESGIADEMVPAYELYPELDSVSVITSRGCPLSL